MSRAPSLVPIAVRRVRQLLWIALGVVWVLLGGLMTILAAANGEFAPGLMGATVGVALRLGLRRLPVGPRTRLGAGYAALAGVLVFPVAQELAALPAPVAEAIAPADAPDRASFKVLMRYGKNHPLRRDFRFSLCAADAGRTETLETAGPAMGGVAHGQSCRDRKRLGAGRTGARRGAGAQRLCTDADMNAELVARAVRRDVPDIDAERRRYLARRQTPIKNLGGPAFLHRITPNYRKVLEAYWRSEALRVTVQQRLQA